MIALNAKALHDIIFVHATVDNKDVLDMIYRDIIQHQAEILKEKK